MNKPAAEQTFWEHEGKFLWDYLKFGSKIRLFSSHHLSAVATEASAPDQHLAMLCVFREMMSALEDLGALLTALRRRYHHEPTCKFQNQFGCNRTPLLYTLVNYRDIGLAKVVPSPDPDNIFEHFSFENLIPRNSGGFITPSVVEHGLRTLARFIGGDCLTAETQGIRPQAYNKIKHGGIVLSDGRLFFPANPSGPAVIDRTTTSDPTQYPLTIYTFPFSQELLEQLDRIVWLSTTARRVILALYLAKEHQVLLRIKRVAHPGLLFDDDMRNLLEHRDPV